MIVKMIPMGRMSFLMTKPIHITDTNFTVFKNETFLFFSRMAERGEGDVPELNPVVKIGGTAMLGTTLVCAATVAIGKNQIAQRAAKKGEKIDMAEMNEGNKLRNSHDVFTKTFDHLRLH